MASVATSDGTDLFLVTRETFDSLIKKYLASGKLTRNAVTLVEAWVMDQIAADRHDDAIALYRDLDAEHTPSDKPAADAWLRLSGAVNNGYEAKLQFDRMKPWAELRIPVLERDLDALR